MSRPLSYATIVKAHEGDSEAVNAVLSHYAGYICHFRHTFCTNMANAGMDIKTLQYVMGHSDVGVTLNVYTHASYDRVAEQMAKIIDFKGIDAEKQRRKSG